MKFLVYGNAHLENFIRARERGGWGADEAKGMQRGKGRHGVGTSLYSQDGRTALIELALEFLKTRGTRYDDCENSHKLDNKPK